MRLPIRDEVTAPLLAGCTRSTAGWPMNSLPACDCACNRDSTSTRNSESPAQARSRNGMRCDEAAASASSNTARICFQRSGVMRGRPSLLGPIELAVEPDAGRIPIALHGGLGDAQQLGGVLDGEPGEESHFDHPALLRINPGQVVERVVQGHDVEIGPG